MDKPAMTDAETRELAELPPPPAGPFNVQITGETDPAKFEAQVRRLEGVEVAGETDPAKFEAQLGAIERGALRELLAEAAGRFREYEASHRAKGTPDADAKAERNAEIAGRIEAALVVSVT